VRNLKYEVKNLRRARSRGENIRLVDWIPHPHQLGGNRSREVFWKIFSWLTSHGNWSGWAHSSVICPPSVSITHHARTFLLLVIKCTKLNPYLQHSHQHGHQHGQQHGPQNGEKHTVVRNTVSTQHTSRHVRGIRQSGTVIKEQKGSFRLKLAYIVCWTTEEKSGLLLQLLLSGQSRWSPAQREPRDEFRCFPRRRWEAVSEMRNWPMFRPLLSRFPYVRDTRAPEGALRYSASDQHNEADLGEEQSSSVSSTQSSAQSSTRSTTRHSHQHNQ
jgi:hypothetical protein